MTSFMGAWWTTFLPLGFAMIFVTSWVFIELRGYDKTFWARIVIPVDILIVLAILVGIWLPVFVPGLY